MSYENNALREWLMANEDDVMEQYDDVVQLHDFSLDDDINYQIFNHFDALISEYNGLKGDV